MRAARRQPGLSHICDSVAEPSSNRRRPSIINPALSSRGSSHNMSPQVILTFFFPPSACPASFSLPSTHHPDLSLLPRGPLWERSLWSACVSLAARLRGLGQKNHIQNNGSGEGGEKKCFSLVFVKVDFCHLEWASCLTKRCSQFSMRKTQGKTSLCPLSLHPSLISLNLDKSLHE